MTKIVLIIMQRVFVRVRRNKKHTIHFWLWWTIILERIFYLIYQHHNYIHLSAYILLHLNQWEINKHTIDLLISLFMPEKKVFTYIYHQRYIITVCRACEKTSKSGLPGLFLKDWFLCDVTWDVFCQLITQKDVTFMYSLKNLSSLLWHE